jgi:hypothetical protein
MKMSRKPIELTSEYKHISHDEMDTSANYAKLNDNGSVSVETLHRYGKPYTRTMEPELFWDLYENGKV